MYLPIIASNVCQVYDGEEPVHGAALNGSSLRGDFTDGAAPMPLSFEGLLSRVQVSGSNLCRTGKPQCKFQLFILPRS